MSDVKVSVGRALDLVIETLEPLDKRARETVLAAACRHLDLTDLSVGTMVPASGPDPDSKVNDVRRAAPTDIRSLKTEKQPKTVQQMACLVAYYLQESAPESERKPTVNAADLEKYFKQAGFKLPSRIAQVLIDAKAGGYFDSTGRGEYRLNAVGYNLVAHSLPGKAD
ncbi:hypothetical protein ABIE51_000700 [Lysobacter sp. OAE881]|uniref:hypothetical protein n=1 Tax=Lysobacter sp. OAE881 TaxID=2663813 RepID=UPI001789E96B